jgi:hypothetical protein
MNLFLSGAITMAYLVASLFFFRFLRRTADPLFLWFAIAFLIFAIQRIALSFMGNGNEDNAAIYAVRLLAFILILIGIWQKNRRR